jgi:hypothetical protein
MALIGKRLASVSTQDTVYSRQIPIYLDSYILIYTYIHTYIYMYIYIGLKLSMSYNRIYP